MSVGSYEVTHCPPALAHRMVQWSGARPNWTAAGGSNRGSGIRFFQDGFTAYPVHIRVFGPASAPSSSQFIHFLDRPTGRDPQDLSAPLDGLCAYIPGSSFRPDPDLNGERPSSISCCFTACFRRSSTPENALSLVFWGGT